MRYRSLFLTFLALPGLSGFLHAQSGIVASTRSIDWSQVGIPGGIPSRTTKCATLNPGATASQINNAIASCPSGQVVYLNAGTYNLTAGIQFSGKSNVTLRGAGPDQTFLVFSSSSSCFGLYSDVCIKSNDMNWLGGTPSHLVNWTAGYAKGTTQITLSTTAGLSVGSILMLDQSDDSNTDTGTIWVCQTGLVCADEAPSGAGRAGRAQEQWVRVTSISGNTVTISPGLYMPNWRASQSPQAIWGNDIAQQNGIEDLSLDHTNSDQQSGIVFFNAYNCWVKNIRDLNSSRSHIWMYQAAANVVRDSYFYGTQNAASQSYGVEAFMSSDLLVENNIFQHIVAPIMINGPSSGSVVAYNYAIDDYYTSSPSQMMGQIWLHAGGIDNILLEGNSGPAFFGDVIHGTHHFVTAFRNYWIGWESGKTNQTTPLILKSFSRYMNLVGNVLGHAGTHTQYQTISPSCSGGNISIYELGCGTSNVPNDALVASTLLRWGNYDIATGTARFVSSEVPSSLSQYANPVPGNQTLPSSFYLSSKPSWWPSATPWPAIGPDVTGGSSASGHAYSIPAQRCYDNSSKNSSGILTFNANTCYSQQSSPPPPPPTLPSPPSSVSALVQ